MDWNTEQYDRVAVFNCYNSLWAQWHKTNLSHEKISAMPPKRRTLFRGVYAHDLRGGTRPARHSPPPPPFPVICSYYAEKSSLSVSLSLGLCLSVSVSLLSVSV